MLKVRTVECDITDILRNRDGKVTIRFNPEDIAILPSQLNYSGEGELRPVYSAKLLRRVEALDGDSWKSYPSASWIGDKNTIEAYTVALIKLSDDSVGVMESPIGMPDARLILEAEKAGIPAARIAQR